MGCLEINELVLVKVYLSFCNYYYCLKLRLGWTSGCSILFTQILKIFLTNTSHQTKSVLFPLFLFFSLVSY
jgi:hypothetical protein